MRIYYIYTYVHICDVIFSFNQEIQETLMIQVYCFLFLISLLWKWKWNQRANQHKIIIYIFIYQGQGRHTTTTRLDLENWLAVDMIIWNKRTTYATWITLLTYDMREIYQSNRMRISIKYIYIYIGRDKTFSYAHKLLNERLKNSVCVQMLVEFQRDTRFCINRDSYKGAHLPFVVLKPWLMARVVRTAAL